ncbi:MAG: cytochrome c-type biogenesis protein CcmH [Actinomycetota bacterium]|nr:cytochrome c-type biogenesis protein CcmH [Actinomycetota bacterium]
MRRTAVLFALVAALLAPVSVSAAGASLVDIEDEVMCVTCKIPLNIAESPQATRERELIRALIDRGRNKQQIKAALVAEYGEDVLALPDGDGFGITAYAIPITLVVGLAAALALLLPRWRRHTPAGLGDSNAPALSSADARRLDEELARYER